MESTLTRIKQYIDYKGLSVRKFEESVGLSNGSFASQYKNGKTIGVDKVKNILRIYDDLSAEWLLTGHGSMIKEFHDLIVYLQRTSPKVGGAATQMMLTMSENVRCLAVKTERVLYSN